MCLSGHHADAVGAGSLRPGSSMGAFAAWERLQGPWQPRTCSSPGLTFRSAQRKLLRCSVSPELPCLVFEFIPGQ